MYPILLTIGPIKIYAYGLFVALAFLTAIWVAAKEAKRCGFSVNELHNIATIVIIFGLLGGRLTFILMNLSYYINNPLSLVKVWEGGMVFYGGLLMAVLAAVVYIKIKKLGRILFIGDILAPSIILGHGIGRIGCFMAGCCYGKETECVLGVEFNNPNTLAPMGIHLHPTQLYELFGNLVIFVFLLMRRKHKKFEGEILTLYVLLYSVFRFSLEFLRGDDRGYVWMFSVTQFIGLVLFIGAAAFYLKQILKKN